MLPRQAVGISGTHGLAAMTSAYHAEGRVFHPGWVYVSMSQCGSEYQLYMIVFISLN